jgi:hypothetical protein
MVNDDRGVIVPMRLVRTNNSRRLVGRVQNLNDRTLAVLKRIVPMRGGLMANDVQKATDRARANGVPNLIVHAKVNGRKEIPVLMGIDVPRMTAGEDQCLGSFNCSIATMMVVSAEMNWTVCERSSRNWTATKMAS